jgi:hypothetical protein
MGIYDKLQYESIKFPTDMCVGSTLYPGYPSWKISWGSCAYCLGGGGTLHLRQRTCPDCRFVKLDNLKHQFTMVVNEVGSGQEDRPASSPEPYF